MRLITLFVYLYPLYTACINYTRPNYAFSEFFLIDREKQDKLLFISRSIFNQILIISSFADGKCIQKNSYEYVWYFLSYRADRQTHLHTYKPRWLHNLLAEVKIRFNPRGVPAELGSGQNPDFSEWPEPQLCCFHSLSETNVFVSNKSSWQLHKDV
jgi:hypothetical protein